ncbi:MAG: hypothetical protein KGD66_10060 [Candidatus Lokiarchaeota archaeon]|nr:hypothetical protein [Candidatus Lokiarchaeota archaeon]
MSDLIEIIIAGIILTPIILINIFIAIGSLFQKIVTHFTQKILKTEDEFKSSSRKVFTIVNVIIWIVVGGINVYFLEEPFSLGAFIVFLTFRSGYTLSKKFIFGIHDSRIFKKKNTGKITKILSSLVKMGIIIEMLFLLLVAILYKYLSTSLKTSLGIEVNILVIVLWISGFIYGIIASMILSSRSNQFLSKNEIGLALLLSGEIVKDKIEAKKKSFQNLFKR